MPMTVVDLETGSVELQRGEPQVNNHSSTLSAVTRSNHHIKPTFTSGYQNLSSMYYMTAYVSKNEDDISDLVAMDQAWRELENEGILRMADLKERMCRLIIRINYIRAYSRQFSGAQVAVILLGIGRQGTHYAVSTFAPLNLFSLVHFILGSGGEGHMILDNGSLNEERNWNWDLHTKRRLRALLTC